MALQLEIAVEAATCRAYGPADGLVVEELPQPWPRADEILVRVHASTVTSGDVRLRAFSGAGIFWLPMRLAFGVLRPRNPVTGMEFSGRVAAVGQRVTTFSVGDAVFGLKIGGANAAYLVLPEAGAIAAKPEGLSFEQAAAVPFGALAALCFVRDLARLKPGQKVLIHGASGAVGVFAVQLARHLGAHVTGVCSRANVGLVKSLGAEVVIDYQAVDFTKGAERYDVILDTVGGTRFSRSRRVLTPRGKQIFVVHGLPHLLQAIWTSLRGGQRVIIGISRDTREDLQFIRGLLASGKIRPVIDRYFGLSDIADAHRYVETGRKRGAVVIDLHRDQAEDVCDRTGVVSMTPAVALRDYFVHPRQPVERADSPLSAA